MATRKPSQELPSKPLGAELLPDFTDPGSSQAATAPAGGLQVDAPYVEAVAEQEAVGDYAMDIGTMIRNLQIDNYLPVIFVGAPSAGKTQVLTSLFTFLRSGRNENSVSLELCKPLVGTESKYGKAIYEEANAFFLNVVSDAENGVAAGATRIAFPFAVPVCLKGEVEGQKFEQKFAFFEAQGEWFSPNRNQRGSGFHPELKPEIRAVFERIEGGNGVVVIYTAPCQAGDPNADNKAFKAYIDDASEAIKTGMTKYTQSRARKERDRHIFLLTKWDAVHGSPGVNIPQELGVIDAFTALSLPPKASMALAGMVADSLYPNPYTFFKSPGLVPHEWQRILMPYSAGKFDGKLIVGGVDYDKSDRYIKSLWNQLMLAAGHKQPLFPPPEVVVPSLWQKFLNLFG